MGLQAKNLSMLASKWPSWCPEQAAGGVSEQEGTTKELERLWWRWRKDGDMSRKQ